MIKLTLREFQSALLVYFLSGNPRMDKWVPGKIVTRLGNLYYEIEHQGKRFKCHVDQIRNRWIRQNQHQKNNPAIADRNTVKPCKVRFYSNSEAPLVASPQQTFNNTVPSSLP